MSKRALHGPLCSCISFICLWNFWHVSASDFDRQASKQKQSCNVLSCHAHKDDVKLFAAQFHQFFFSFFFLQRIYIFPLYVNILNTSFWYNKYHVYFTSEKGKENYWFTFRILSISFFFFFI